MSTEESTAPRGRRERSARYPGVPLAECVEFCRTIDDRGLDGLTAADIATAMGFTSIKTNTFSARLSATRQFGLLILKDEGYHLSPLARGLLHPVEPSEVGKLRRQALLEPPIYADLAKRHADKKVPETAILANILYHHFQIIASAKQQAADAFVESARFAGALGDDGVFRPLGSGEGPSETTGNVTTSVEKPRPTPPVPAERRATRDASPVKFDLRLWGDDQGKILKVRGPESISRESYERFLDAFRLHVRIDDES